MNSSFVFIVHFTVHFTKWTPSFCWSVKLELEHSVELAGDPLPIDFTSFSSLFKKDITFSEGLQNRGAPDQILGKDPRCGRRKGEVPFLLCVDPHGHLLPPGERESREPIWRNTQYFSSKLLSKQIENYTLATPMIIANVRFQAKSQWSSLLPDSWFFWPDLPGENHDVVQQKKNGERK